MSQLVRLFDLDPDLLSGLDRASVSHLRGSAVVRLFHVSDDEGTPAFWHVDPARQLGVIVVDGLLVGTHQVQTRTRAEVVGPGDVIRPWDRDEFDEANDAGAEWRAIGPASMALLDERFSAQIARYPPLLAALMARASCRSQSLMHQATIAHVRDAETRLVLTLRHLANRWGRVTSHGVVLPYPLTHRLLAQLTCLQRPTVSSAVGRLARSGVVSRRSDGTWVMHSGFLGRGPAADRERAADIA